MWGKCGVWVDCKRLEFVTAGCCTRKWLRFDQTIRNLTSGDLRIPLEVSRQGVTGLKKASNQFHNILRLLDVLRNFPFTTSETMSDYYS